MQLIAELQYICSKNWQNIKEIQNTKVIFEKFNILLSIINRTARQKLKENIMLE